LICLSMFAIGYDMYGDSMDLSIYYFSNNKLKM
jgi:hypothetical protein